MTHVIRDLEELLKTDLLAGRSMVVLSDTYPPYTNGGAEISLSVCIDSLSVDRRKKILILTSSSEQDNIEVAHINDVLHVRVPASCPYPHEKFSRRDLANNTTRKLLGYKNFSRYTTLRRMISAEQSSAIRLARKEARLTPKGGFLSDHLVPLEEYTTQLFSEIIASLQNFDVLLSDNTRSILLGARIMEKCTPNTKSLAVVRDNRFHCPRPTQSANIRGKMCETPCKFECAEIDVTRDVSVRKAALARTLEYRKTALEKYTSVITTSHQLVRCLAEILENHSNIVRVPNGFGDIKAIDNYCFGVAQDTKIKLVIIGMLNENKGQFEFIKAATRWLKKNKNVQIVLCGRGDRIAKAIRQYVKKEGIDKQIKLLGFRSREYVYHEIRKSKLVLAPTVWPEPFGRVPLEAGIAGRVIIAFAVGGLTESVVDGKTGFLIEPGNYNKMILKIEFMLNNHKKRLAMERQARDHIVKNYDVDKTATVFSEIAF